MKIRERMVYLQQHIAESAEKGTTEFELWMYESALAELIRVSSWLENQCRINNTIFFEPTNIGTKPYIKFQNTTGMGFRFIGIEVKVIREDKEIDSFEIAAANWKDGEFAKLYFDKELEENDALSFNPDNVEYQIMKG